jgi:bifunctional non-homologous end joining protein LigD
VTVALSNLERVLWPETGFTKGDMIDYYGGVAPALLPHLSGRPLTLWRFPSGVHRRGWWQNDCRGAPGWMRTATVRGQRFCVVDDVDSLIWVANQGTIELHPFPFRADEPERPLALVFDLDPGPPAGVEACAEVALLLRELLGDRPAFAKTSGSAGLHVHAPVHAGTTFTEAKAFARQLAESVAAARPDLVVTTQRRSARPGKVLVDWLQNDPTRSTVAPYSLRATRRPSVATPVTWDEVAAGELAFGPADVVERLERQGDLLEVLLGGARMPPRRS